MLHSDKRISDGLATLRSRQPNRTVEAVLLAARQQHKNAQYARWGAGLAATAAGICVLAVALRPSSALASLRESERISNAQAAIELATTVDGKPDREVWIFPDHMIRKRDHVTTMSLSNGTDLTYDDRFDYGYSCPSAAWETQYFKMRVSAIIDKVLALEQQDPRGKVEKLSNVPAHGGTYDDYRFTTPGDYGGIVTDDLYVDPDSKLLRFDDESKVAGGGPTQQVRTIVKYPDAATSDREAPRFEARLRFQTADQIRREFKASLGAPEQSKKSGSVRIDLYAVLIGSDPGGHGLSAFAITRGGAAPNVLLDRDGVVLEGPLAGKKRSDFPPLGGHSHLASVGPSHIAPGVWIQGPAKLLGREFIVTPCDQLLTHLPKELTIRVPVWEEDASRTVTSTAAGDQGKNFHPSRFMGYVEFRTKRIVTDFGDDELKLLGQGFTSR